MNSFGSRVEIAYRNGVLVQELRFKQKEDGSWLRDSRKMLRNGQPVPVPWGLPERGLAMITAIYARKSINQ